MAGGIRNLAAYRGAIRYVAATRPLVLKMRGEDPTLADQMHRAVVSIALNVAEGAGEFSPKDKARFYRYALRSCTETLAVLDVAREIGHLDDLEHGRCFALGDRLAALLTRLVVATGRGRTRRGPDSDTEGSGA